jgi:hypothetical protein
MAYGQNRHRRIVAMQPRGGKNNPVSSQAEGTTVDVRFNLPRSAFVQSPAAFRCNTQVRYRKGQERYSGCPESR